MCCLLAVAAVAWREAAALSTDRDQPVNIEADWAEADDSKLVTVYKGKVIIVQGSIRITGDVVTMYFDEEHELQELIAVGRLARFRQLPDKETEYQRAKARRIEYYLNRDRMVLIGSATLAKGEDRISADRIVYDTVQSRILGETLPVEPRAAQGSAREPQRGRVRIVITPKKKCKDAKGRAVKCAK